MWHVSRGAHLHESTRLSKEQKQVTKTSVRIIVEECKYDAATLPFLIFFKKRLKSYLLHVRNGLSSPKEGEPQFVVVHCTGCIKSWPPAGKTN